MGNGKDLFPMMAMGAFFILFCIGFILGHMMDLHLLTKLALGFVTGYAGVVLVTELERQEPCE